MSRFHFGIDLNPIQPLQGWVLLPSTQGRRGCANPGLYDCNPFRVALLHRRPEVDGYHGRHHRPACGGYHGEEGTAARDSSGYRGEAL